jgi:hypothetical protein
VCKFYADSGKTIYVSVIPVYASNVINIDRKHCAKRDGKYLKNEHS